jgi:hypothetical protein
MIEKFSTDRNDGQFDGAKQSLVAIGVVLQFSIRSYT